ncbi:hypothetical protein E2C01_024211 [Portunus trituberculatus]|uniref:Uncharacterized protein n=1 Tax=Portunus trituberculatus TaxID=210409 RepID=A0A5B7EC38_PORTR|nr:hypothetical protein [Portunus trituberculatus]
MAELIISFAVLPMQIELVSVTKSIFCSMSDYWGFR